MVFMYCPMNFVRNVAGVLCFYFLPRYLLDLDKLFLRNMSPLPNRSAIEQTNVSPGLCMFKSVCITLFLAFLFTLWDKISSD